MRLNSQKISIFKYFTSRIILNILKLQYVLRMERSRKFDTKFVEELIDRFGDGEVVTFSQFTRIWQELAVYRKMNNI